MERDRLHARRGSAGPSAVAPSYASREQVGVGPELSGAGSDARRERPAAGDASVVRSFVACTDPLFTSRKDHAAGESRARPR